MQREIYTYMYIHNICVCVCTCLIFQRFIYACPLISGIYAFIHTTSFCSSVLVEAKSMLVGSLCLALKDVKKEVGIYSEVTKDYPRAPAVGYQERDSKKTLAFGRYIV